ncbi:hypothetical protein [Saccharothrix deserti]|uniref:hypothetical protein n=1 Tax=Saccharothrix deserti TaxID=2593674 RepID=UPI00131E5D89|nr:hypothetical protein [Saccharothrix deserti]
MSTVHLDRLQAQTAPTRDRPRVLLAPITITPTKPLTLSHLKGLLWTDVMYRATAQLADVTYRYSHTTYNVTEQTLGFWEHLDRTLGDVDYSGWTEEQIGECYIRYRADEHRPPPSAFQPYADAVEQHGWTHPATSRVLELWTSLYDRLGLHDPGLREHQPPGLGLAEMIDRLDGLGMCLDLREHGGPVYLDATRFGLPLRQIVLPGGRPNYLACALRELIPLAAEHDEVVLIYDRELEPDYLLLQRVLSALGPAVRRVSLGRVPVAGQVLSARHGGWQGNTVGDLLDRLTGGDTDDPAALRLGLRLYFIAVLGQGQSQSFRDDLVVSCLAKARKLLATTPERPDASVSKHRRDHVYVDPYRLTSALLARHQPKPGPELISAVFT